jgi:hypothetical protein
MLSDTDDKVYHQMLLQVFIGSVALTTDSFITHFYLDPAVIKEFYVPFVINTPEE